MPGRNRHEQTSHPAGGDAEQPGAETPSGPHAGESEQERRQPQQQRRRRAGREQHVLQQVVQRAPADTGLERRAKQLRRLLHRVEFVLLEGEGDEPAQPQ